MNTAFIYPTHGVPGDSGHKLGLWYWWIARLVASIRAVPVLLRASRRTSAVDRTLTRANPGSATGGGSAPRSWLARSDTAWTIARVSRITFLPEAATATPIGRSAPLSTYLPFHRAPGVESPLDGTMVAIDEERDPDQRGAEGNPGRDSRGRPVR